ncbi:hypothetical protein Cgig2_001699 [Carnegiea gigantea]|uniref:Uncharacterized protein n=1 Tax=Carnegiea gigantea TaxID=171969 RepID=A0A9Q1JNM4_9CARY|nr:hypothetical protein Cgig2_001699 [Carnegiea gigantea]
MEGVELAIPSVVHVPKLMGSEVILGARVCATEAEAPESDGVSQFSVHKIDDCCSIAGRRGISGASEPCSQIKKGETELYKASGLLPREETEDSSRGLDHGIIIGSATSISGFDGKTIQRKVGKAQRNGNGPFKKLRMSQVDNLLPQAEADDTKMESDKLGSHLVKCSNAGYHIAIFNTDGLIHWTINSQKSTTESDKSQAIKQKNTINARRGDRKNAKVPVKAKYDTFLLKAGLQSLSPASGGTSAFGTHGLKPEVHDVTKLVDDISLDELLNGSHKCSNLGKDTANQEANGNGNILDSVIKACSILRLRGLQQGKQTEESDIHVNKKIPLLSSSCNRSAANSHDGDESSLAASLSKCSKDQESPRLKAKASADKNRDAHFCQPREVLERLALPPRDLESLLQDAVKPVATAKVADSRCAKPLSTRVSLPPFPWSHSFNGHHKSNNDAIKSSNRSICQGRWVRIRSEASFTGAGAAESLLDLDSLTYDDGLVPSGKLKYELPEIERSSSSTVAQHSSQHNLPSAVSSAVPYRPQVSENIRDSKLKAAVHSPRVMAAAQTLCDMATHCLKQNSNGILKWPKQPSLKAMKARKSREPGEEPSTLKLETTRNYEARVGDHGSSAKKPKLSGFERTHDFSHFQAVIGLSSVSAPRSSRPSPIKLFRDPVSEARQSNGSFPKPSFTVPPPPRVLDRSTYNSQKPRKLAPVDWNRSRS